MLVGRRNARYHTRLLPLLGRTSILPHCTISNLLAAQVSMSHSPYSRLAAALILLAPALAGCGQSQPPSGGPPPPTVTVAKPIERGIADQDEYVGRFVAVDSVEIRARVSGYLDQIHFRDGQMVKQGDLLFTIDKRPFQNTLDQARANLELAKSTLTFTQSDLGRGQQLLRDRT